MNQDIYLSNMFNDLVLYYVHYGQTGSGANG